MLRSISSSSSASHQSTAIAAAVTVSIGITAYYALRKYIKSKCIPDRSVEPSRYEYNKKRNATYPDPIQNSWYGFCFSDELKKGEIKEMLMLYQNFILWRDENGKPVCQDAYCIHLGANFSSGGKIEDGCLKCPFHEWKFDREGKVVEIPYNPEPHNCPTTKTLKTYPCVEYCGIIYVYYHADGLPPQFELPAYADKLMKEEGYFPYGRWDSGIRTVTVVDWVDQFADYSHFNTLHQNFLIPFTMCPIPDWLFKLFPIGIQHKLRCYRCDDDDWVQKKDEIGVDLVDKHFICFTDAAGLTWNGKLMDHTISETVELGMGPNTTLFYIPFKLGTIRAIIFFTPTEGGTVSRAQYYLDGKSRYNPLARFIAWIITGIGISQLEADTIILEKKIRLRKPMLQAADGPWNRVNSWLKHFYSESSSKCHLHIKNDW